MDGITLDGQAKPTKGGIQSLERAAALLDAVAANGERGANLTEMASRTRLHPSTAFHLIKTLEQLGFLARAGDGKQYYIGARLHALGAASPMTASLVRMGQPILDKLSAETGEASHLAIRTGGQILVIARADAKGMLQMSNVLGQPRPPHATAIGKVLLALCGDKELDQILATLIYQRFTLNTVSDASGLRAELERVRSQGYAEDRQELDPDIRCIAVAIPTSAGRGPVALGLSGPVWRMDDAVVLRHRDVLNRHAGDLAGLLA